MAAAETLKTMRKKAYYGEGLKRCPKCGRVLPVTAFGRNKGATDGLRVYCKECIRDIGKEETQRLREDPMLRMALKARSRERAMKRAARCTKTEKRCCHCKRVLPLNQFHKCNLYSDGHSYVCKECCSEYARQRWLRMKAAKNGCDGDAQDGQVMPVTRKQKKW